MIMRGVSALALLLAAVGFAAVVQASVLLRGTR